MFAELSVDTADEEQEPIIDPLGFERVSMKELVLTGKREALKLETMEWEVVCQLVYRVHRGMCCLASHFSGGGD